MIQPISLLWLKKWLQVIFPIRKGEKQKIFLLLFLKFLISFVYCILVGLKDTVLVTADASAAEVIPIIKGFIIFPISIGVVLLYTKLNNCLKQSTLFYGTILFFLALILLYGFLLYPHANKVSPYAMADWFSRYTGGKYLHWITAFRHWIHVLFFVVAELWGQVALMLLYWSFVNHVCKIQDAKRFYAILIAAGDVALIVSGPLVLAYTKKYSHSDFVYTVQALIKYVAYGCVAILLTYWFTNRMVKPPLIHVSRNAPTQKLHLSLWKSLQHVASSPYLGNIAIMVVACGLSINIVEGTWKSYLKEAFPRAVDYQTFISKLNFWTGIIALLLSLFFSGGILRKFGWKRTAQIVPVMIGIMGALFFLMSYTKNHAPCLTNWVGSKLVLYIVIFGGLHNIMAKSIKYAFFDKTTQMAYIPLDLEAKIKGKAAVDLLGSRLGKAGSSWIQIGLLELLHTSSMQPLSGILLVFLLITNIIWYRSAGNIDQQLHKLEAEAAKNDW